MLLSIRGIVRLWNVPAGYNQRSFLVALVGGEHGLVKQYGIE